MQTYVLIKCLKCGRTFKSNENTERPKCSVCGSYKVMNARDVPAVVDVNDRLDEIERALNIVIEITKQHRDNDLPNVMRAFKDKEKGVFVRLKKLENTVDFLEARTTKKQKPIRPSYPH